MLTKEENELITRTGPGTPMGNLFRQYWLPCMLSSELPFPDCPPVRIRILSEDLVAFRTTSGRVGLIQQGCPHRMADFYFGRNEEEGIRCTYHGWKFDVTGACVDMPSEPAESTFKDRVKAVAYPTHEVNGAVWVYMGPRAVPPPLPDLESAMRPGAAMARASQQECNWLQAVENNMDTAHLAFLHFGSIPPEAGDDPEWANSVGSASYEWLKYALRQRGPRILARETPAGMSYTGYRDAEEDTFYHRTMHFLFPCFTMSPAGRLANSNSTLATVPIDDYHMMEFGFSWREGAPPSPQQAPSGGQRGQTGGPPPPAGRGAAPPFVDEIIPNGSQPLERFRFKYNMSNDFGQDREIQRTDKETVRGFMGMGAIGVEDRCITISQGPITDRSVERLGTTDAAIIKARRLLINDAIALRDHGKTPRGVDNPEFYRMRSGWAIVPRNEDWWEYLRPKREAYADMKRAEEAAAKAEAAAPVPTVS
jgi:phenylpropionate dioxygenase-like ring-hydroxylating dioxygenase large terminal subunit